MRFTLVCVLLLTTLVFSASLRATEQRALENSATDSCERDGTGCRSEAPTILLQTNCKTTNGRSEVGEEEECY